MDSELVDRGGPFPIVRVACVVLAFFTLLLFLLAGFADDTLLRIDYSRIRDATDPWVEPKPPEAIIERFGCPWMVRTYRAGRDVRTEIHKLTGSGPWYSNAGTAVLLCVNEDARTRPEPLNPLVQEFGCDWTMAHYSPRDAGANEVEQRRIAAERLAYWMSLRSTWPDLVPVEDAANAARACESVGWTTLWLIRIGASLGDQGSGTGLESVGTTGR